MAFKMKGSAFKLNNVATKSALKQGAISQEEIIKRNKERMRKIIERREQGLPDEDIVRGSGIDDRTIEQRREGNRPSREEWANMTPDEQRIWNLENPPLPMKSPLEQGLPKIPELEMVSESTGTGYKSVDLESDLLANNKMLEDFKKNNPEKYAELVEQYETELPGLGGLESGGKVSQTNPENKPLPLPAIGWDFIDKSTKGGRKKMRQDISEGVDTKIIEYLKNQ